MENKQRAHQQGIYQQDVNRQEVCQQRTNQQQAGHLRMRKQQVCQQKSHEGVLSTSMVGMVWNCRPYFKTMLQRKSPGQGTTEYAILVGVLVVIAILAITVFRPKLEELWEAISSGINSL